MDFQIRHYTAAVAKDSPTSWYKTALAQLQEDRAELVARIAALERK